jgi:5-(carboxyamino)imidazole ribonucleotide mutase
MPRKKPEVAIIMGSASDWPTMKHAVDMLRTFGVACEHRIVSAHRTPDLLRAFGRSAAGRGLRVIIAGAGGAAHLPGMIAAHTWLPVLGVPIKTKSLDGIDSLLSIAQMPAGIAVGTLAIGEAGAKNAGLLAASIIGLENATVRKKIEAFRKKQTETVLAQKLP